ncbi:Type IV secretion protein Rhs OS=Streptomyces antimycoticus OX=68175 GN=SSPO_013090 PE=4 SV=1 [Streptomyces antimycoticus]
MLLEQAGVEIGTEVRLLAGAGGGPSPRPLLPTGSVTALEVEIDDTGTFTVVRGLDESHRLFRGRQVASYQNMTLADICVRVARRAGLKPGKVDVAGPVLEHVAQPNISDWEFLRGLAEEAGAAGVCDGRPGAMSPSPREAGGAPRTPRSRAVRDPAGAGDGGQSLRCRAGVSAAEQVSRSRCGLGRQDQATAGGPRWDVDKAATLDLGVTAAEVARPFGEAVWCPTRVGYRRRPGAGRERSGGADRAVVRRAGGGDAGATAVRADGAASGWGRRRFEGRYTSSARARVRPGARLETGVAVSGQQERSLFGLTGGGSGGGGVETACPLFGAGHLAGHRRCHRPLAGAGPGP